MSDLLNSASLVMIPSGYKEDVVYSQIPTDGSGDLSFTRASNGTRVNSAGLVEVCPWNLVQNSENFDAVWTKYNGATVTVNAITAPNGTTTADLLIAGASQEVYSANMPKVAEELYYTFSCYAKLYNTNVFKITASDFSTSGVDGSFNLSTLTATYVTGATWSNSSASIESVGDGWYRCILTSKTPATTGLYLSLYTSGTNSVSGVYIWGAQVNIGSTAKPYFPTTDRLNVPRLTYQNGGGGCPSLLLEKQSTNQYPYSEDLSQWNVNLITRTSNYAISPDGTQNADRVQFSSTASLIWQNGTGSVGTNTLSVWAKATSGTAQKFRFFANGATTLSSDFTATDQWQRFEFSYTFTAVTAGLSAPSTGASDVLFWGMQAEASSYATSYIPTTSSSATRVADECVKTGISSLIGQTSGTVFVDAYIDNIQARASNILFYLKGSGVDKYVLITNSGGVSFADFPNGNITNNGYGLTNGRHKFAIAYANNDFVFYIDGNLVGVDTNGTPSVCSDFGFFYYGSGYDFPLKVNEAVLFKTRLTNAELASLTTI